MQAPGLPAKQFRLLGGVPLLVQTLRTLDRHPVVDALVVVGPPARTEALEASLRAPEAGLAKLRTVVPGGATRQASVAAGLAVLPPETDLVLVHDAVRPMLPADRLAAVVAAAHAEGAAALALAVADTVRRGAGGCFGETVPREGLWRMQTPQAFRVELLRRAHAQARADAVEATDEVELVRRLGHPVRIVEGSPFTFKVTTPDDWALAEALWGVWERSG